MFRKLKDVPECLGNINGVDYEADIPVRLTTKEPYAEKVKCFLNGLPGFAKIDTLSLGKEYHVHKITSYGDLFDVWVTNDKGEEEEFAKWLFEDIN